MFFRRNSSQYFSSAKRIYLISAVFIFIVSGLLFFTYQGMELQAGIRAYVGGAALWSENQKDAVYFLIKYTTSHSEGDYQTFLKKMDVFLGDQAARLEMEKPHPDEQFVYRGMLRGHIHPDDIKNMTTGYLRFRHFSYFKQAREILIEKENEMTELLRLGETLHQGIRSDFLDLKKVNQINHEIEVIDEHLTLLEDDFSTKLGEAARRFRELLFKIVFATAFFLLAMGIYISWRIMRQVEETENTLRENEARLRLVTEQVPAILWTTDKNLKFTSSMGSGLFKINLQQNQVVGMSLSEFFQTDDPNYFPIAIHRRALEGKSSNYMTDWMGRIFQSRVEPFYDKRKNIIGTIGVASDITDVKRATESLEEEKERLNVTLRSIGDGVITTDMTGNILLINPVAEMLTGWTQSEAFERPLSELFHIINEETRLECENPVSKVLAAGGIVGLANHTILIAKDGSERNIADSGAPIRDKKGNIIGVVLVFRDVTEKKKMEEEQFKTMKLESIGLLAGGIAHDFNNILTAILGNVSLAKIGLDPGMTLFKRLDDTEKAVLRARDLASQLLTFSKGGAPRKQVMSIVDLLKDSTIFSLRGANIRPEFYFAHDLWEVDIDEGQIGQVVHNLVINAQQAMVQGGVIMIRAENVILREEEAKILSIKPGRYIKISVKDTGTGIPREYLNKIFDPYFTTKEKGSGLGLSTTYSIIKRHNGAINVSSEAGAGTTFTIYLPSANGQRRLPMNATENLIFGQGKILLLEDEEDVRETTCTMLETLGYEVESAENGQDALDLYKKAKKQNLPFNVVILDLTLPGGMSGKETMKKLMEFDPGVKGIVSSGYSNDLVMANFKEFGFKGTIGKPYHVQELSKVIHKVIHTD